MPDNIHVYAGTAGHSAWFSEDAGAAWLHPNSHSGMYLEARVWAFASHAAAPDTLYAGTDMGVFRWSEAAARWTALPSPLQDVWAIAQRPDNPAVLIAGTRPAAFWRSDDGGINWRKLSAPGISEFSDINMGPTRVTQILFDPRDADTVWASVEIGGIFVSRDGGETWARRDEGLISADVHGLAIVLRPASSEGKHAENSSRSHSSGHAILFATTNMGLHRSLDDGATWTFCKLDSPWQYTRAIVPRADGSGVLFLTNGNGPPGNTGRLLMSRDCGDTWEERPLPGALNSTPWCVATHASDPLRMFVCTNLGQLFRSTDGGESFERLPQEFGEVRALHWRPLPAGSRKQEHSITRRAAA
jgi:photosystem II stability/assembly factor-like uncharacterized protein